MEYEIIISKSNPASQNIKQFLKTYKETNKELIYADTKTTKDIIIFACTHKSITEKPCFCIHYPGNFNKAELGGKEKTLNIAASRLLRPLYQELKKQNTLNFEIAIEADHHGPNCNKPCLFIEIGSSEKQWNNKQAGKIIATTIQNTIKKELKKEKTIIIFGGTHYNQLAIKALENTNYNIGHICSKYNLPYLTKNTLKQALEKNQDKIEFAYLDKKIKSEPRKKLIKLLEELNIEYKTTLKT